MARDESVALGGFYPTPPALIPSIASLISFETAASHVYRGHKHVLFDPCAGEGEAISNLRDRWWREDAYGRAMVVASEMEPTRARALAKRLPHPADQKLAADAFALTWPKGYGCSLLFLNPPYDTDPEHGRLEQRFLARFTDALAPGGALLFVLPVQALAASAKHLGSHFTAIRCWRFPDGEFEAYKQVVVIGRRTASPLVDAPMAATVESWARFPARLLPLPLFCPDPLRVPLGDYALPIHAAAFDRIGTLAAYRPWEGLPVGVDLSVGDLGGRVFPTALPPKPAHLALALANGHFNGHRIAPDPGELLPPLLVKGMFTKELIEVERKLDKEGELKAIVKVQQPTLRMSALRLDTFAFFEPRQGAEPTALSSLALEEFNMRDILDRYGSSFGRLMQQQFPPLHDPSRADHQMRLPDLSRKPFRVQNHAIQAALKLLATERNPKFVAEVGTGKCLGRGTPVLMFDGSVRSVETITVGDRLMGPDSRPRIVKSVACGWGPMFQIKPVKGEAWTCNDAHMLTLVQTEGLETVAGPKGGEVYDIALAQFLALPRKSRQRAGAKLIRASVDFRGRETLVCPYVAGVWLGDGSRGTPRVTASEPEIVEAIRAEAARLGMRVSEQPKERCHTSTWSVVGARRRGWAVNIFKREMDRFVEGPHKTIPPEYLLNSRARRLELLAGLLDTDGHLTSGVFEIATKSPLLCRDILFLARSLGFGATAREKVGTIAGRAVGTYHRIFISGDVDLIPCRLAIRKAKPRQQNKNVLRTGFKVEALGEGEYFGFELDGDGRFLLGDFTVTHNTTMALNVWAALSPRFHAQTVAELARVGFRGAKLLVVRRMLVLCPPHLLDTWTEEILGDSHKTGCAPWAKVKVVRTIADLRAEADIYVMSRENAKLGHGYQGVEGACPRCGAPLPEDAETNAAKRLRCQSPVNEPGNAWAHLAEELAAAVLRNMPDNDLCVSLTGRHRTMRQRAEGKASPTIEREAIRALMGHRPDIRSWPTTICGELAKVLADNSAGAEAWGRPIHALEQLAVALGEQGMVAEALEIIAAEGKRGKERVWSPFTYAEEAAKDLRAAEARGAAERTSPEARLEALRRAVWSLQALGTWENRPEFELSRYRQRLRPPAGEEDDEPDPEVCGEPLYQAIPEPRRFPLAKYIMRFMRDRFDLLVLDELHEFSNQGTAQEKAAHRLAELHIPVLALTGSIMSGYSSSLFANWWSLDRKFREEFDRDDAAGFVKKYGFRKFVFSPREAKKGDRYGAQSDREEEMNCRSAGEVPGVLPLFLLRYLLPAGVVVHKDELDVELPAMDELQVALHAETAMDAELLAEYHRITAILVSRIAADMFTPLSGKLWGAMMELPSYLDRCTEDQGPFELRYPKDCGGMLVAEGKLFPAGYITPKERAFLAFVEAELAQERRTMAFIRHVNGGLPQRLDRLLRESGVTRRVKYLNASKVPAPTRKAWINEQVIDTETDVLIVNPNSVRTGLNNLIHFCNAWWHETDYSAQTYRQANGRLHRVGQTLPVHIRVPHYHGTAQSIAVDLVARKVTASLQVDGLSVQGALEAAGSELSGRAAVEAAMKMGQAIYERLKGR